MQLAGRIAMFRAAAANAQRLAAVAAPLLTRLGFGQMFVLTGLGKLANLERTTEFFAGLGIPFASVQAPMIAALEFAGGIALLLGVATRTFALLLASTMVVAILTNDGAALLAALPFAADLTAVAPVPPLLACAFLFAHGAGAISLDAIWNRRRTHPVAVAAATRDAA